MIKKIVLFVLFSFLSLINVQAATCTASAGNWGTAAIWSCGHTPTHGDHVIIPEGVTVDVDAMYGGAGGFTGMIVEIYGTLNFIGGRKITLAGDGVLIIHSSGLVTGGNGGSQFEIGGTDVYVGGSGGQATGPLTGPTSCNSGGCVSVVPIKLVSFTAKDVKDGILLTWVTESETNNSHFTIERSLDGLNFEKVTEVKGTGNSIYTIEYTYLDKTTLKGTIYYRLKQTDFNGNYEYFDIITVYNKTEETAPAIFPNPSNGNVVFFYHNKSNSPIRLVISEISGMQLFEKNFESKDEFINEAIDLTGLKKGYYFAYIFEGDESISHKIIIL